MQKSLSMDETDLRDLTDPTLNKHSALTDEKYDKAWSCILSLRMQ